MPEHTFIVAMNQWTCQIGGAHKQNWGRIWAEKRLMHETHKMQRYSMLVSVCFASRKMFELVFIDAVVSQAQVGCSAELTIEAVRTTVCHTIN